MASYDGRGLLGGRRALVTGHSAGLGKAIAVAFAKEGADVAIAYVSEHEEATRTQALVVANRRRCLLLPGDLAAEDHCCEIVERTVTELGGIDVLVNNVGAPQPTGSLDEISSYQWEQTFRLLVHSRVWVTKTALGYMGPGASIINTMSAADGHQQQSEMAINHTAANGAVLALTRALARMLRSRGIRVNAVCTGHGNEAPQPDQIAPSYVFLAAGSLSSCYSGNVLAPRNPVTT